ncbi:GGDEF domain-containing protein [Halalkalibacillus sediminis]|uniref:GGDEF domain-containing protein n=1 Tax=Halalkalibacillus sediminis TaxID=2018042 RepID=A0A2I0QXT0_9BACI|nr:sensor domain-containing diguanylate cyclase [Halalkalibacillus sediminis]PKR79125.1 GGDEF domain-containing protein [Halalkalibacillus sediminis]
MTRSKSITIWTVWFVLFPPLMIYLYFMLDPTFDGYWLDLLAFAIIMSAVAIFPIRVGSITVFFLNSISFAIFLYFGLFAEIVLTQISLIALYLKIGLKKNELHKIPMNSTMLLLTSIFSAGIYYALGGTHGVLTLNSLDQIIPLVGYILGYNLANQLFLMIINAYIHGRKSVKMNKSLFVDGLIILVTFPLGLVLYILYLELKISAILFVGIPFVLLSIVISFYHNGRRINRYLHTTSQIGHELSKRLNVKAVLDTFVQEVSKLIPAKYIYIFDVTSASKSMSLIRFVNEDDPDDKKELTLYYGKGFAGKIYAEKESSMVDTKSKLNRMEANEFPNEVQSAIGVPIKRNDHVVGVLLVASNERRVYEKYHVMLLEILANFLSVAMENARHYESEKLKSQRDELTGLYNYRFLSEHIDEYANDLKSKGIDERLSIIILDLDSFKRINDTYGHEAGNEILSQLAERLQTYIHERGIVARYGGEEFTILLKGFAHIEVMALAEEVRKLIAEDPFVIKNMGTGQEQKVNVTASIGVATYPDHCESPQELLRQADRAMYVGAKRDGKNKVASNVS